MIWREAVLKLWWIWNDLLKSFGLPFNAGKYPGELRVLCFHGICNDQDVFINGRFMHLSQFCSLLDALKEHFNLISLDDFLVNRLNSDRLNVLITFDDGYRNNLTLALPELEKRQIPATLFVTASEALSFDLIDVAINADLPMTALKKAVPEFSDLSPSEIRKKLIDQKKPTLEKVVAGLQEDLQPILEEYRIFHELLTNDDLQILRQNPLISVANHGGRHLKYPILSREEITDDYSEATKRLESIGSPYLNVFAFPFGCYSEETRTHLKLLGAEYLFTADGKRNHAPAYTDRMVINPYISLRNQLIAIRNGQY